MGGKLFAVEIASSYDSYLFHRAQSKQFIVCPLSVSPVSATPSCICHLTMEISAASCVCL